MEGFPWAKFEDWLREVQRMRDLPDMSGEAMGLLREAFAGGYASSSPRKFTEEEARDVVRKISRRLGRIELSEFRAGGRSAAFQAIQHREEVVLPLMEAVALLEEEDLADYRQGYVDALKDILQVSLAASEDP